MTFSLVARCPRTGQFGVGAATAMPAAGKLVAYAGDGIGAAASQARLNPALADRLLVALDAGVAAGGDTKGERSATIYVMNTEDYPLWDIRVDEHDDPIGELRRPHAVFASDLLPRIAKMPARDNPAGEFGEENA